MLWAIFCAALDRNTPRERADYLLATPRKALGRADRLRLLGWPAPIAAFAYALFVKGCVFDGWRGWYYALQRVIAEAMLAIEIVDRRLRRDAPPVRDAAGEENAGELAPPLGQRR